MQTDAVPAINLAIRWIYRLTNDGVIRVKISCIVVD